MVLRHKPQKCIFSGTLLENSHKKDRSLFYMFYVTNRNYSLQKKRDVAYDLNTHEISNNVLNIDVTRFQATATLSLSQNPRTIK